MKKKHCSFQGYEVIAVRCDESTAPYDVPEIMKLYSIGYKNVYF